MSLHFCFTKIARDKTEKGKGGYWELSMNATKSEKKRIRNRRKHREDNGRIFQSHRSRLAPRKNVQRTPIAANTKTTTTECLSNTKTDASLNNLVIDSCNGLYFYL